MRYAPNMVGMLSLLFCGAVGCEKVQPPQAVSYPTFAVPRISGVMIPNLPAVTGRIHVDQFGYLTTGAKVAVISNPQKGYNAEDKYQPGPKLELRLRSNGSVIFSGAPTKWKDGATHEDSGDQGWWFDFSSVKTPGEYYVFDPATQLRSPTFKIGDDVYNGVLRAAVRTYFYQRLSWTFKEPSAEKPWLLPSYMDQDHKARSVTAKDVASTERDLSGGWMDAGDTNKYPPFNGDVISSLLFAYTANPAIFGDDFGIPESGNGLPDLLDEVKYQLDWLVKMQDTDGGVYVKMGDINNSGKARPRYYGPKCTGATITSAMNFAQAARVFGKFPQWKSFATQLQAKAEHAWEYFHTHPMTTNADTGEIRAGIANRSKEEQDQLEALAAIHLFALTHNAKYNTVAVAKAGKLRQLAEYTWSPYSAGASEALIDYLGMPSANAGLCAKIRAQLKASSERTQFAPPVEADLYRAWMNPEAYHWGSNTVRASFGFAACTVAENGGVSKESQAQLRQRGADMLHSFHGVNPLSIVYLTNMEKLGATLSAKRIWHERFNFDTPFASNPPPGYVVGGPNQSYGGQKGERKGDVDWIKKQPRAKAYADFNEPWPMNSWELTENAIYYQAAYIRLLAAVMPKK